MKQAQKVIKVTVGLLELAKQLGNVSQACRVTGYSRDSFYRFGPAGLFKQDVAFRDRTGPRKRNLLRASRLGRIDKVRPIRQNMPIW